MPSLRALPTGPPLSVIERPRCQDCQTRTILRRNASGPAGYEFRTFACPKCDCVQRTLVVSDPMSGDARGWLRGELKTPRLDFGNLNGAKMAAQRSRKKVVFLTADELEEQVVTRASEAEQLPEGEARQNAFRSAAQLKVYATMKRVLAPQTTKSR